MSNLTAEQLETTAHLQSQGVCAICEETLGTYGGISTELPSYCTECLRDCDEYYD